VIIDSLDIYGFGKLENTQLKLGQGINLIEGLNEAGKSTVMAFIRSVLFGFAGRRTNQERFEPIHGGKFGGVINFLGQNGQIYRVERVYQQKAVGDVRIYLPNGSTANEEYLETLIGKINERVYRQIFSFSLTELQQLESLQDEQINDFIYHAGTGAAKQILKMKQFIEQKQQSLFKNSGRKPEINLLLAELESVSKSQDALKQKNAQHQSVVEEIQQLSKQLSTTEQNLTFNKSELDWLQRVDHYYQPFKEIIGIEKQLSGYPSDLQFPDNGLSRLEQIAERLSELEVEYRYVSEKEQQLREEQAALNYDSFFEENAERITNIRDQLSFYQEQIKQNSTLKIEETALNDRLAENLSLLGQPFTVETVRKIDISLADKQFLQELNGQITAIEKQHDQLGKELELQGKRSLEIKRNLQKISEQPDSSTSPEIEQVYLKVKDLWQRILEQSWQKNNFQQQQVNISYQIKVLQSSNPLSRLLIGVMIGLIFLTSGILSYLQLWGYAGLLLAFAIFASLLAVFKNPSNKSLARSLKHSRKQISLQLQSVDDQLTELKTAILGLIQPLGFTTIDESVMRKLAELRERQMIEKQSSKETALRRKDYLQELQAIEDERRILSAEKETLAEKLVEKKKILADWLTSNYLRKDLSPMIVFETIALIQSTKDLIAKVHNSLAKMTAVNQNIGEYEQQLMELTNGKKHFSGKTVEAVYWLNEQLKHNQALSSRLINIQGQLADLVDEKNKITQRIDIENSKFQELLLYAKSQDKEDFYRQAKRYADFLELNTQLAQLNLSIQNGCRSDQEYQKLRSSLNAADKQELVDNIAGLSRAISADEQSIKELSEKKGSLQNQLKRMEEDFTLSELNQEYVKLQADLKNKVKNYTAISLAQSALSQTMRVYENEKQPRVIKRAAQYFQQMTGNNYHKIVAPMGSPEIEVERADGVRFLPNHLSRGTVEQLFIAMRFALVEEFSQQVPLPVILDDVLVNFDERRLGFALQALNALATTNQIIFFTCHQHIAKKLTELNNDFTHLILDSSI